MMTMFGLCWGTHHVNPSFRQLKVYVLFLSFFILGFVPLGAQNEDMSALLTEKGYKSYLLHTVKLGLPVVSSKANKDSVPYWPEVKKFIAHAEQFSPLSDITALDALVDIQENHDMTAESKLASLMGKIDFLFIGPLTVKQAYYQALLNTGKTSLLRNAWVSDESKYLALPNLLLGLENWEKINRDEASNLLKKALELYPGDRRLYPEMLIHSRDFPQIQPLLTLMLQNDELPTSESLNSWCSQLLSYPEAWAEGMKILKDSGVLTSDISDTKDYALALKNAFDQKTLPTLNGLYHWNWDGLNKTKVILDFKNSDLNFLEMESSYAQSGNWRIWLNNKKIMQVAEERYPDRWVLRYLDYPFVKDLTYKHNDETIVYSFQPFETKAPLLIEEIKDVPEYLKPQLLAHSWQQVDIGALLMKALRVETFVHEKLESRLFVLNGQVWLAEEDSDLDGKPDTWSYYRNSQLDSVYHNYGDLPLSSNIREIYRQGKLQQVMSKSSKTKKSEYVLFPQQGVELWDWNGQGSPFIRVFHWSGGETLKAVVFSKSELPFMTMPSWEVPPWQ